MVALGLSRSEGWFSLCSSLAGKQIQVLSGHLQWVYCCSISPDCSMLCSAAGEKSVSIQCVNVHSTLPVCKSARHVCAQVCVSLSQPSASMWVYIHSMWVPEPYTTLWKLTPEHDNGRGFGNEYVIFGSVSFSRMAKCSIFKLFFLLWSPGF